jgi:hypothetical protein
LTPPAVRKRLVRRGCGRPPHLASRLLKACGGRGFTDERQPVLDGFLGGVMARRAAQLAPPPPSAAASTSLAAQDRVLAAALRPLREAY